MTKFTGESAGASSFGPNTSMPGAGKVPLRTVSLGRRASSSVIKTKSAMASLALQSKAATTIPRDQTAFTNALLSFAVRP